MNDKCAAGTGRFLGAASAALDIPLDQLGPTALRGERPVKISTTCTVFAESEVLSWLGKGKKIEDILLGVHQSIAMRSVGLLRRVGHRGARSPSPAAWRATSRMVETLERAAGPQGQRQRGLALHGRARRGAVRPGSHPRRPGARPRADGGGMKYTAGIDIGSTYTKAVVLDEERADPRAAS